MKKLKEKEFDLSFGTDYETLVAYLEEKNDLPLRNIAEVQNVIGLLLSKFDAYYAQLYLGYIKIDFEDIKLEWTNDELFLTGNGYDFTFIYPKISADVYMKRRNEFSVTFTMDSNKSNRLVIKFA